MEWILGAIALVVALASLWLTTEAERKFTNKLEVFVQSHVTPLRQEMSSINESVGGLNARIGALENDYQNLKATVSAQAEALAAIKRDHDALVREHERLRAAGNSPARAR